ncbi:MAG: hypothetical protein HDS24_05420 [Bacteroides sp.]|nr:hypothetical protein [Bacteroides sp.]
MTIQEIKQDFFAYRNGMVADTLRRAGYPHKVIFGLNLPQIAVIAGKILSERDHIAEQLWKDPDVRESRLLACYLYDPASLTKEECIEKGSEVRTREEADMFAFRVLKRRKDAVELLNILREKDAGHADSPATITAAALSAHLE